MNRAKDVLFWVGFALSATSLGFVAALVLVATTPGIQ